MRIIVALGLMMAAADAAAQTPAREAPLPLKHIRLSPSGDVWMALGGTQRFRVERDENYLGGGSGVRDDGFGLSRTQLSVDLHLNGSTHLFVEGRHVTARSRDLPGGIRSSDRDNFDWAQLYAERSARLGTVRSSLKVGRQEFLFGRERIVTSSDWSNVRRLFDAATLMATDRSFTLTAFYSHPVLVRQTEKNERDNNTDFWGIQGAWKKAQSPALLEIYAFDRHTDSIASTPETHRLTLGARALSPIVAGGWQAELEGGVQTGSRGSNDVRAFMFASDLTRTFTTAWSPSITFGFDVSSGTGSGEPSQSHTWDVLYTLGHSYTGYADVNGRRNLTEFRGVLQAVPTAPVRLRLAAHAFRRTSTDDAVYDDAGGVFRPSIPDAPSAIGKEVDFTVQWRFARFFRIDAGGARYAPGAFLKATGPAQPYTWMFASVAATY